MVTILTHSNRSKDSTHTSWHEILAFESELKANLKEKILTVNHHEIDFNLLTNNDQIFIFATGSLNSSFKSSLEKSKAQIYFIIQDPNWPTDIRLNSEYKLITPFKALNEMSTKEAYNEIKETAPNILLNEPLEHVYLPFGNMSLTSRYYHDDLLRTFGITSFHKTSNVVYAGSLKEDRKHLFKDLVKAYPDIDFIGNFDQSQFERMTGEKCNALHFKGKRPASEIKIIYKFYDKVVMMPDRKMIDLDVSYIRHFEMYIGDAEIELFTDTDISDKAHRQMKKVSNQLEDGSYKINLNKLEKTYGLMSQAIQSKLRGSY